MGPAGRVARVALVLLAGCAGDAVSRQPASPVAPPEPRDAEHETASDRDAEPEPTQPAVADADIAPADEPTPDRDGEDENRAETAPIAPSDPHPLLLGYARVLRDWMTAREAQALDAIDLHGTGEADASELSELLRYTLFRELGGRAIASLPHRELRRYGRDIRQLPPRPTESPASSEIDVASAHMNVEAYWHALSDLLSTCGAELAAHPDATERCGVRYERARAAGSVASYAYDPLDLSTMAFEDPGVPLGDGLERRAPPKPLVDLLRDAETAGLPRPLIRRIALDLLRRLVREATP